MAVDKVLLRIERKLDALLEAQEIDPAEFGGTQAKQAAPARRELTPQEQQAIDNAPKVTPAVDRNASAPANVAPPASATSTENTGASVPPDAVGTVTVETQEPDGDVSVETKPASRAKEGDAGKRKS